MFISFLVSVARSPKSASTDRYEIRFCLLSTQQREIMLLELATPKRESEMKLKLFKAVFSDFMHNFFNRECCQRLTPMPPEESREERNE